jgi:hypothetical protein
MIEAQQERMTKIINELILLFNRDNIDNERFELKLNTLSLLLRAEELITSSEYQAVLRHKKPKGY